MTRIGLRVAKSVWCKRGGTRDYVTTQPVDWWIGKKNSGWKLIVPVGKEFESSVPRLLWWLWSPDDPYFLKAAAIHDTLLEQGYRRTFADSQWFETAMSEHAPKMRTSIAYMLMVCRRMVK